MRWIAKTIYASTLAAFVVMSGAASAHEGAGGERSDRRTAPQAQPSIDPLVQAILVAAAASVLKEAAASPDPFTALGESIERKLMFALRSPELARLLDQLIAEAVKDAPRELREPLAQFAIAMLNNFRREMLDKRRQP